MRHLPERSVVVVLVVASLAHPALLDVVVVRGLGLSVHIIGSLASLMVLVRIVALAVAPAPQARTPRWRDVAIQADEFRASSSIPCWSPVVTIVHVVVRILARGPDPAVLVVRTALTAE
jgi:hypothetical protein